MSDVKKQVSKLLAEEIIRAIKKVNDDNNRSYVDPQLRNYRISSSNLSSEIKKEISNIAKESAVDSEKINSIVDDAIEKAVINTAQIADLDAKIADITVAEIQNATIDTAQVENLYGTVADFIYLAAENAQLGDVEAKKRFSIPPVNTFSFL